MAPLDTKRNLAEMDLPEDKGTYILIAQVLQMKRLVIGSLGDFDIVPGFYAYVGSAFGSGGLRARVVHHLKSTAEPHWHIDYLLQVATPVNVWFSTADRKLERRWAELLEDATGFHVPILRFGSSDYHRSRSSHAREILSGGSRFKTSRIAKPRRSENVNLPFGTGCLSR